MPNEKQRADKALVDRGLFESRAAARAAIEAGRVRADGRAVTKPSEPLAADARIEAEPAHPYVSRGGVKLAHGLDAFGVDPAGRVCLDVGASTGGFTDALIQRGAARVYAVDVGRGQLRPAIASDPRVVGLEGVDARALDRAHAPEPPSLVVCDVSFIGLEKVLATPLALAAPGADLVALFKPQFQVGRAAVGKGGIVSDAAAAARATTAFEAWLEAAGWPALAWTDSPIRGGDGNAERLVHARRA